MEFDESEVKDTANYVPDNYAPKFFANSALGQSLVSTISLQLDLEESKTLYLGSSHPDAILAPFLLYFLAYVSTLELDSPVWSTPSSANV